VPVLEDTAAVQRRHRTDKTTLLAALLGCVPAGERIVCVEEAPELEPGHPHVVRLAIRAPNIEGAGEVTLRDRHCQLGEAVCGWDDRRVDLGGEGLG
jgi:hypothetical protein